MTPIIFLYLLLEFLPDCQTYVQQIQETVAAGRSDLLLGLKKITAVIHTDGLCCSQSDRRVLPPPQPPTASLRRGSTKMEDFTGQMFNVLHRRAKMS